MDSCVPPGTELPEFLRDAQRLLSQAQECLLHLQLIDNDPDACRCLNDTLTKLAKRAEQLGLDEVAHYSSALHHLLAPACGQRHLHSTALPAVEACLNLLDWQLELIDAQTGQLNLDRSEQAVLLDDLASALQGSAGSPSESPPNAQ
ncbi:histidine kinase [Pseudomonas shirazensis]|uniref:histidine kinase n=1 Tax=Pseudomonas shirazensis TaxID=2745494 RepID=UPI003D2D1B09